MAEPFHVAVLGAELWPDACRLAERGVVVTVVEADPHDQKRLSDMASRTSAAVRADMPLDADLLLTFREMTLDADISACSLNWQQSQRPVIQLLLPDGGPRVIEYLGPGSVGVVEHLARALGAQVIRQSGPVPASHQLRAALSHCIETLVLEGGSPMEVDDALCAAGFAFGPFGAQDDIGVDRALAARRAVGGVREAPLFARAVAEGRLGRSVGVGWYRYPGDAGRVEDPLVEDMATEEARFAGIPQTFPKTADIVARVKATLARAATEIDLAPKDLDVIAQAAVGAPRGMLG